MVGERGFEPPAPASRTRSQALQTRYLLIKTPVNQGFTMQQRAAECNNVPNFPGLLEQDWSTDQVSRPSPINSIRINRRFRGPPTYTRLWTHVDNDRTLHPDHQRDGGTDSERLEAHHRQLACGRQHRATAGNRAAGVLAPADLLRVARPEAGHQLRYDLNSETHSRQTPRASSRHASSYLPLNLLGAQQAFGPEKPRWSQ